MKTFGQICPSALLAMEGWTLTFVIQEALLSVLFLQCEIHSITACVKNSWTQFIVSAPIACCGWFAALMYCNRCEYMSAVRSCGPFCSFNIFVIFLIFLKCFFLPIFSKNPYFRPVELQASYTERSKTTVFCSWLMFSFTWDLEGGDAPGMPSGVTVSIWYIHIIQNDQYLQCK